MNAHRLKALFPLPALVFISLLGSSAARTPSPPPDDALERHLTRFLDTGSRFAAVSQSHPLFMLRSYPFMATTAFLLMENEPSLLKDYYPEISRIVMLLFAEGNTVKGGLVGGMSDSPAGEAKTLSPGLNALANLELYSLHLIAWKVGAYEDALEYLAWSNNLSQLVTRSFYEPSRECFYPLAATDRFITAYSPGQLLPLVLDASLGPSAHERIVEAYRSMSTAHSKARPAQSGTRDPWDNPSMRYALLPLLETMTGDDSELLAGLSASAEDFAPAPGSGQALWTDFWRENPAFTARLFPRWRAISTLVNMTLLFEREALLQPKEISELRASVDSLVAALSKPSTDIESYTEAIGTANKLLTRVARIAELIDSKKERWRILDERKWLRLSPRIRRLVTEGCAYSSAELARAKAELSARLEKESGIAFRLDFPARRVPAGKKVEFSATLRVASDTLAASQLYLQIGDVRWKMMETSQVVTLIPRGAPLRYEGTLPLPPTTEPGIVTFDAFIDFVREGRRIEIHRIESIVVTKEYDVALDMPQGHRIKDASVPLEITLAYSPDHDIQGTVEGAFLREFTTTPPLPARFLVSKNSERTNLTLNVAPKGLLSPGRYPFSLTVSLTGKPIALFEESLVRAFRWLHLGPFAQTDGVFKNGLEFQADLLRSYTTSGGDALRWKESSPGAIDDEGALWPQRLYGKSPDACMLLYTVVDAPSRMKLLWKLTTKNAVSLWINSELVVSGGDTRADETGGPIDLRKGPNSFLIAACWNDASDRISFELGDASGLPPAGLSNDLETIVDGYERLTAAASETKKEAPHAERLREIVISFSDPDATDVSIIGSFNNWEPGATPMKREGKGAWKAGLSLRPGKYPYKLLVNRKNKIVDPTNKVTEPDGFGGFNSVLEVR